MYSPLETRDPYPARHPGVNGYSAMLTRNDQGMRGLRGLPPISFALGPGGQFSISAESVPTSTSMIDQVKMWMGQSTVIAGVPNSLILVGGSVFALAWMFSGRRR